MEIIWYPLKPVTDHGNPDGPGVVTAIDWRCYAYEGVHRAEETGITPIAPPDEEALALYLIQPTPEQEKLGVTWDEMPDPPGFKRPEWLDREKDLKAWLFAALGPEKDAIEARLVERTETVVEREAIVQPVEMDEAARLRIAALEREARESADLLAYLIAPVADLERPEPEAPLLPAPDARLADYGPVGTDDITGDLLLDAFEENEAETAAVIQVLSATRQRHLSEQLNVEKARLRREHMLTDQANPREASIDRLLGLLTRRGD